jgi:hypothetical protein
VYEHADEGLVESFTPRRLKIAGIEAPCHSYVFKP